MNNEYFTEMHRLIEKAKTYERAGREEEALKAYLEIHERFFPNTSDLYDRPAILLEKRRRFDEAIAICEKAIKFIDEGKITGIKDNFQRRIDRIKDRTDYQELHPKKGVKKSRTSRPVQRKPRTTSHTSIFFKLKKYFETTPSSIEKSSDPPVPRPNERPKEREVVPPPVESPIEDALSTPNLSASDPMSEVRQGQSISLFFTKLLNWIKDLPKLILRHIRRPNKNTLIALGVIIVFTYLLQVSLANYDRSKFEVYIDMKELESTGSPIGNPFPVDEKDLPAITQSMIDTANKSISQMPAVKTSGVIVQKNVIGFVIMLNPGTSAHEAKDVAETYVRALSAAAAAENKDLSGPNPLSYGSLYDSYGALVVAGEDQTHIVLKGTKNPKSLLFNWKK